MVRDKIYFNLRKLDLVNKYMLRLVCNMEFEVGEMCLKLYIDLGGRCEFDSIGFYCLDI